MDGNGVGGFNFFFFYQMLHKLDMDPKKSRKSTKTGTPPGQMRHLLCPLLILKSTLRECSLRHKMVQTEKCWLNRSDICIYFSSVLTNISMADTYSYSCLEAIL